LEYLTFIAYIFKPHLDPFYIISNGIYNVNAVSIYKYKYNKYVDRARQRLYNFNMKTGDYRESIGKKVRQERLRHGWSQEELAEKIEVHPSFVGQIERGIRSASFATLKRLSLAFGIKPADFLTEDDTEVRYKPHPMERRIINLLKGCTLREQKAVYQTVKYMLRQKRKLPG